ncbi:MAG: septum formation initiator family protein [Liquorilactobacillus nagelii]|uniref:Dihydroorotate dehydrogenase n=1 Tax=Liquorilactobacillus nagelii TaxID=82688 RepID=A0A3Q8CEB3_9LACO|nr:septum formation initiator family protein [Liquorilactobacillus nagelii]AUJ31439.1 hypothetical protein BSQ50_01980 [Liquorilactobacillus nagelii]
MSRQRVNKVEILNNSYFEKKSYQAQLQAQKLHNKRVHRRRMIVIIAFFAISFLLLGSQVFRTQHLTSNLVQQKKVATSKLDQVSQQHHELKQQTRQLKDDDYLQKLIREKYYYSKNGETIYNLPNNSKTADQK